MKIKNKELRAICSALLSLGNHQGDITNKWMIAKITKKFNDCNELLTNQINELIEEQGEENENGEKVLSLTNKDYLTLMNLDIDVDCKPLSLEQLNNLNPSVEELMFLEQIIEEKF